MSEYDNPQYATAIQVTPRKAHWARKKPVTYDDRFIFLVEAVGRLAMELNEPNDPNSPLSAALVRDRIAEIERHCHQWTQEIDKLFGTAPVKTVYEEPVDDLKTEVIEFGKELWSDARSWFNKI